MSLTVDQIVAETSRWPADAVADLVGRIPLAKPGGLNAEREAAWAETASRRSSTFDSGQETLVSGDEVSACIRRIFQSRKARKSPFSPFTLTLRLYARGSLRRSPRPLVFFVAKKSDSPLPSEFFRVARVFRGRPPNFASLSLVSRATPPDRPYPRTVVYVSCDPATQMRDLKGFLAAGYTLTDVQPFDLFPQTRHLECTVTLMGPLV